MLIFKNNFKYTALAVLLSLSCMHEDVPRHLIIRHGIYVSADSSLQLNILNDSDVSIVNFNTNSVEFIRQKYRGEVGENYTNFGPSCFFQYIVLDTNIIRVDTLDIFKPTLLYYLDITQRWAAAQSKGDSICISDSTIGVQIISEDSLNNANSVKQIVLYLQSY